MKTRSTIAFLFAMLFLSHNLFSREMEWLVDSISPDPHLDDRYTVQSFAFDEDNTYHMVFNRMGEEDELENGGFTTYYTSKPCDGEWTEPEIIHPYGESTVSASIVHTEEGRIFVCYQRYMPVDYWSDVIYVAEKTDQGWVREQIPTPTDQQNWLPQMTADGNGKLHIVWVATDPGAAPEKVKRDEKGDVCTGHKLAYSTNISGEWNTKILDKVPIYGKTLGTRPLIEATPEGTIHMIYRSGSAEDHPEIPFYRMYYATNLTPGGEAWEIEMLQSPRVIDETGLIFLDGETVHVAIGGKDAFEDPPYCYYTKKEEGQWEDMVQVNNLGFGFPTALEVKNKEVFITYISAYFDDNDEIKNGIILWNKDGESVDEYALVSSLDEYTGNDYVFDNHGNIVLPYLRWKFFSIPSEEIDQENITESENSYDKISKKPLAVDQLNFQHLVYERESLEKGVIELYYQNNFRDTLVWSEPEIIPVPGNYSLVNNSSSIAATQHEDSPEIYVSFIADNTSSESREFVIAKKTEAGWEFSSPPFFLEGLTIENSYISSTQYGTNILHAAVFGQKQVNEDSIASVIHYGILSEGEWNIQVLELDDYTEMVSMEITELGYAKFVYTHSEEENQKMTIFSNDIPGGTNWSGNTFPTVGPIEKISTATIESGGTVFVFMATQVKISEYEPSEIYFYICLSDGTILEAIRINSENNLCLNLKNITGYWGYVTLTYFEHYECHVDFGQLRILNLNSSLDSFTEHNIPEIDTHNCFANRWDNDKLAVISENGDPVSQDLDMYLVDLSYNTEVWSNLFVLRSDECSSTGTITPEVISGIRVYPNPANEVVNVELEEFAGEKATISIYDISGKIVYHLENINSSNQIKIDVSGFNHGIYLIKAATETQNITRKIIIG